MLHIALYADDRARLAQLVRELPDKRIGGVIVAAAQADEFDEALTCWRCSIRPNGPGSATWRPRSARTSSPNLPPTP